MKLKQYILIEIYLIRFKHKLQYPCGEKHLLIKDFRKTIYNALEGGDKINNMGDIYGLFGTPDDSANKFMELILDFEVKTFQKERKIKIILLFFIIFLLLMLISFTLCVHLINRGNQFHDGSDIISTSIDKEVT